MLGARILVVEDEYLIRMTLSEALSDEGFEVVEASSGDEAAALLGQPAGFALLLTDVQLPGALDGVALARTARQQSPLLPVIFMTGQADPRLSAAMSDRDVTICKPYLLADICAAARRLTDA